MGGVYTILQVSPLTLATIIVYTSIAVSTIFETVRPLVSQKDPIPLYWFGRPSPIGSFWRTAVVADSPSGRDNARAAGEIGQNL